MVVGNGVMVQLYNVQFAGTDLIWRTGRNASSWDWTFEKGDIELSMVTRERQREKKKIKKILGGVKIEVNR